MKKLNYIGTIELISFLDDQIKDVPAKVDTGADGSAIWASNIHLNRGKLSFNFFAPGSVYYHAEPIVTEAFKVTSVKNSFGHQEFRYKIRLRVQVGSHVLTRWFSLADRSNSTYPVLLGKNFLKDRFVVNVAKKFELSAADMPNRVLVLGTTKSNDFFKRVTKFQNQPITYECIGYDSLVYKMDGINTEVLNMSGNETNLADYAFVYFKSHAKFPEFAVSAAEYLHFKSRPYADSEISSYISQSKLSQYMKLNCYNLPVPPCICTSSRLLKTSYKQIVKHLGAPFILKEIGSDRGKNNYFIRAKADFDAILKTAPKEYIFLAQKYIENDGFLRLYVLGSEVVLAIHRDVYPHPDARKIHLNKPRGSKNASKIPIAKIPSEVKDISVRAAMCLNRQVAGVDLVQDKLTKKWYILEVNNAPQIRSGSFIDEKAEVMANFFDNELRQ